jgi:cation diffusion facilitator family transporter
MPDNCCAHELTFTPEQHQSIKKVLWVVFAINLSMFFIEIGAGLIARSSTLTADSLDMLADAFVYGLSLYVLKQSQHMKARASLLKGVLMSSLGLYVIVDSFFKIYHPVIPVGATISIIGVLALIANLISFALLSRHKNRDINMKSAWICSRNDVTTNIVVIIAGFFVIYFNSMWPDIIVGLGMSFIVLHSSLQIVRESWQQSHVS